jgi:hypothetical protein
MRMARVTPTETASGASPLRAAAAGTSGSQASDGGGRYRDYGD